MQSVQIKKLARYTTGKDGTPLKTKDGRPYTSVRFQCSEYPDRWISGFGNPENAKWNEGDQVEVEITEKGDYLNFSMPKKDDKALELLEAVRNAQVRHTLLLEQILANQMGKKDPYPRQDNHTAFDDMPDDSPF